MLEAASLFTDGAVLCREKEIRIFGRTDGMIVTARLTDHLGGWLAEGAADAADGRFVICLPPQHAQTGCCLVLESGTDRITAAEIAIGDVYLAGGQSNMEMELRNAAGGTEQVQEDPWLRFYNVPKKPLVNEEQQQAVRSTRWQPVTRENAGFNSAVAMYFGMAMRRKHPEIPVGIIGCYWGGTSVTCWMDQETLRSLAEGIRYLNEYDALCGGKTMETYLAEEAEAQRKIDAWEREASAYRSAHPGASEQEVTKACGLYPWDPPAGPGSPFRPAGLAESMLQEVFPAALTAILFYQGEEDTWKTEHYDLLLEAMIRFWRKGFRDPELPFLFVQLPMWIQYDGEDTFTWAQTRLAQATVRDRVRNTGMICLLDEGEYGNIHPLNKRPVGERLAELAGKMLYGEGTEAPRAAGKEVNGSTITVRMTQPLRTRDGEAPALLEIAGADGRYVPARGEIRGCELRISAAGIPRPVSARYAWTDWSDRVNLCGENGLPAEPFLL
jgi:sialate O-acetylesterase